MGLYERIEPEISGNAKQKEHRKELLKQLIDAFAEGGKERVASDLAAQMEEIEEHFDTALAELDAKL